MAAPTPPHPPVSPDSGPTDPTLPKLPAGWTAQWDNGSRKYYYVQISTGVSQWDLPTSEAPVGGGSSHSTPAQHTSPYSKPDGAHGPEPGDGTRGMGGPGESDRSLGSFAMNALMGNTKQSGHGNGGPGNLVGQLAGSLLGGGKQNHGGGGSAQAGGGSGNLVGQLAGSLLGGGKQSHGASGQQQHGGSASSGGIGGLLGSVMGGGSHNKPAGGDFGYSHNASQGSGGTYTGTAPPASYQPGGQPGGQHGSHNSHNSHNSYSSPAPGQYGGGAPPQHGGYGQGQHGSPQQQHQAYGAQAGFGGQGPSYGSGPPGGYGMQAGYGGPAQSYHGGPPNYDNHQHNQYGGGHGSANQGNYGGQHYPPPPQGGYGGQQGGYGGHQGGVPPPSWH
ncbi:hypothetical protein ACEQ8H_006296 [Pleosporales sp. CAS-2024a]